MSADEDTGRLRARLRELEADLAALRAQHEAPTDEPQDFGDAGADLAAREEQASVIANLEAARDRIKAQLGET